MKLRQRTREGVVILEPIGPITIGQGDVELREAVHGTLHTGAKHILIDFKRTTATDSSSIAELVATHRSVTARGGTLKLVNLPARLGDVLGVAELVTIFDVFDDEAEAVASYGRRLLPVV